MKYFRIGNKRFYLQNPYVYAFLIVFVFAVICVVSFFRLSILSSFSPIAYTSDKDIDTYYDNDNRYVHCTVDKLYYTGYDYISHNRIAGHYYYTLVNDRCTIYLLSSKYIGDSSNPPIMMEDQTFNAVLKKNDANFKPLLEYMAADLNWNYSGILRHTNTTIVNQYDYNILNYVLLFAFTFASVALTLITGILAWHHSSYTPKKYRKVKQE